MSGNSCVCVKPSQEYSDTYLVSIKDYNAKKNDELKQHNQLNRENMHSEQDKEEDKIFYLYQTDFGQGTYRITESGTYIMMEDITFDFNRGLGNEDGGWVPQHDQSVIYPGAEYDHWRDPFFMGFFAGVTVECDNVIIDLNGNTIKQSFEFYYQQRWFSLIELGNQPFLPAQGPGFFGANPVFANNVEIKNGKLGLTSHHGIHGNGNKYVNIHDIEIFNFETHGIQLNGFENIILKDIEIHDSSQIAYLRAEYGHARQILPRIKLLIDSDISSFRIKEKEYNSLKYNPNRNSVRQKKAGNATETETEKEGRDDSSSDSDFLEQLYDDMMSQMNMAFEYVLDLCDNDNNNNNEKKWSGDGSDWNDRNMYELWLNTKENFLYMTDEDDDISLTSVNSNTNGLPYGSVTYGIFLTYPGANVLSFGNCNSRSYNAIIENIEIHGLRHKMHEYLRISFITNPFNALIDASIFFQDPTDLNNAEYVGNIMTDAYAALDYITNNWGILQMMDMNSNLLAQFALGVSDSITSEDQQNALSVMCNADAMSHSGKGTIGIRLDGVEEFAMNNIHIYDMYDYTKRGSEVCGPYTTKLKGHFLQTSPIQYGFSGNMVHGINIMQGIGRLSNINIHDIGSASGLAHGISVYGTSQIGMNEDIIVKNIVAGFQIDIGDLDWDDAPSRAPEACGIYFYWMNDQNDNMFTTSDMIVFSDDEDELNIRTECIRGHVGCFNEDYFGGTMAGTYSSCDDQDRTGLQSESQSQSQGMLDIYVGDIDRKLLGLKDTSGDLIDFDTNVDSMTFDDSLSLYMKYHMGIDTSLSSDDSNSKSNSISEIRLHKNSYGYYYTHYANQIDIVFGLILILIIALAVTKYRNCHSDGDLDLCSTTTTQNNIDDNDETTYGSYVSLTTIDKKPNLILHHAYGSV